MTAAFSLAVGFLGEDLLRLLYHGGEYQGQTTLLRLLALALLASTMSLPASTALAAMQRPRLIVAGAFSLRPGPRECCRIPRTAPERPPRLGSGPTTTTLVS